MKVLGFVWLRQVYARHKKWAHVALGLLTLNLLLLATKRLVGRSQEGVQVHDANVDTSSYLKVRRKLQDIYMNYLKRVQSTLYKLTTL